jgi:ABC-type bacteriocin/lantibiotic exporter with double-glycine peptidase domain
MSSRTRRLAAVSTLVLGSAALCAIGALTPRSVAYMRAHPAIAKAIRARLMGASYVAMTAVVHQQRTYDCGAACLKMILSARGIDRSLDELTVAAQTTQRGASLLALRTAAQRYGVRSKAWSLTAADLVRAPFPVIAFVGGDHYVVIRSLITSEILEVDDPAIGKLRWPLKAFTQRWSGETLVFDPAWTPPRDALSQNSNYKLVLASAKITNR